MRENTQCDECKRPALYAVARDGDGWSTLKLTLLCHEHKTDYDKEWYSYETQTRALVKDK